MVASIVLGHCCSGVVFRLLWEQDWNTIPGKLRLRWQRVEPTRGLGLTNCTKYLAEKEDDVLHSSVQGETRSHYAQTGQSTRLRVLFMPRSGSEQSETSTDPWLPGWMWSGAGLHGCKWCP